MATTITSPIKGFTGRSVIGPTTVEFKDGTAEVDELSDGQRAYLAARGYTVADEDEGQAEDESAFDPAKHNVDEVRAYLDGLDDSDPEAHDAEVRRIVEAEKAGKNRTTLLESIEGTPDGGDEK